MAIMMLMIWRNELARLGSHQEESKKKSKKREKKEPNSIRIHFMLRIGAYYYNLALFRLVAFAPYIRPRCLSLSLLPFYLPLFPFVFAIRWYRACITFIVVAENCMRIFSFL